MRKILITGGAGFIGSHLAEKLIKENYVIILDNFDPYYSTDIKYKNIESFRKNKNFCLIQNNISNSTVLDDIFNKYRPEIVFHLAAKVGIRESVKYPTQYAKVNILGTIDMLEKARKYKVRNFIFTSSSSVYGNNNKLPFNEKDRVDSQKSPYAFTKRVGELICQQYANRYGLPIACFRLFTVYGPRQRPNMAIATFIRNISNKKQIVIYGDGTSIRDYIYIDDVVEAFMKCINKYYKFEIFNIGSSSPIKLNELIKLLERIVGMKAKQVHKPRNIADMEKTYADTIKSHQYLGWIAKTDFLTGLQKTIDYSMIRCK